MLASQSFGLFRTEGMGHVLDPFFGRFPGLSLGLFTTKQHVSLQGSPPDGMNTPGNPLGLVVASFPQALGMKWHRHKPFHLADRMVDSSQFTGSLLAHPVGQVGIVMIFELVDDALGHTALLELEVGRCPNERNGPHHGQGYPILFLAKMRQSCQTFLTEEAEVRLPIQQQLSTPRTATWKKEVEQVNPRLDPSALHRRLGTVVSDIG